MIFVSMYASGIYNLHSKERHKDAPFNALTKRFAASFSLVHSLLCFHVLTSACGVFQQKGCVGAGISVSKINQWSFEYKTENIYTAYRVSVFVEQSPLVEERLLKHLPPLQ